MALMNARWNLAPNCIMYIFYSYSWTGVTTEQFIDMGMRMFFGPLDGRT